MAPAYRSLGGTGSATSSTTGPGFISPQVNEIIKQIGRGKCTLFLGAGASLSAGAPTGDHLSEQIISGLLRLPPWPMGVDHAFSLALANRNRGAVEMFLRRQLQALTPSESHNRLPWFRWRALITTNYDTLIEQAYDADIVTQRHSAIINESDLPKVGYSLEEYVPVLKPHGCISSSSEMSLGLEGIHSAKKQRRLMFSYIEMLHLAGPVIYIGYSMRDTHIIDMICELKERLKDRTEILFVTKQQEGRNEIERAWFRSLGVEYLDWGFEGFMDYISTQLTPEIGPSKIVPQLSSCRIQKFGDISYEFQRPSPDVWECWLDYKVSNPDDYVGFIFQTKNEPLDLATYNCISFEVNAPDTPRRKETIEAVKLESHTQRRQHSIDLNKHNEWQQVTFALDEFKPAGVRDTSLRQVVFTDTGRFAAPGKRYKVGIRNVRFETALPVVESRSTLRARSRASKKKDAH